MKITNLLTFPQPVLLSSINAGDPFVFSPKSAEEYGSSAKVHISSQTVFMRTKSPGVGMGNFGFMNIETGDQFSSRKAGSYEVYRVRSFQAQS